LLFTSKAKPEHSLYDIDGIILHTLQLISLIL